MSSGFGLSGSGWRLDIWHQTQELVRKQDSVFANYKSVFSRQFAVSLAVEFLGVMFFQIIGGTSAPNFAPFVTGPPVTPDSDLNSWGSMIILNPNTKRSPDAVVG